MTWILMAAKAALWLYWNCHYRIAPTPKTPEGRMRKLRRLGANPRRPRR